MEVKEILEEDVFDMKLFEIYYTNADTCGNTWDSDNPSEYVMEKSLKDVWSKLKKPRVATYFIGDKSIFIMRTPKGQGYGIWEPNPEFDWERDMNVATGFETGGFSSMGVEELPIRKL
jgi:hypothetical protein